MTRTLVLASRSPRRQKLLEEAGWIVKVQPATLDDGELHVDQETAEEWTTAMAWLKAKNVYAQFEGNSAELPGPIVAGDTVCAHGQDLIGQPSNVEEASEMIQSMRSATHTVCTALCIIGKDGQRHFGVDTACVTLGELSDAEIGVYLESDEWKGKAGGYNLMDRVNDGWPISWEGEASTIMGMPLPLLRRLLEEQEL